MATQEKIRKNPKLQPGVNDFATLHPQTAEEWHQTKNGNRQPGEFVEKASFRAWWVGKECGHEWDVNIQSRAMGAGCPYCGMRRVLSGFNDLTTLMPHLAAEWHPTKNGDLTASEVVANGSTKTRWWLRESCGHEWSAPLQARNKGGGCPYCAPKNKRVESGVTDLEAKFPDIAADWHPTKNGDLKPSQIIAGSNKEVWWLGKVCGHEWFTKISSRTRNGYGCTVCSNRVIVSGINDLASQRPNIAQWWHPTKNGDVTPDQVGSLSGLEYWWQCDKGHEWLSRVVNTRVCHVCSGSSVFVGYNDLASQEPEVAKEWHPTKNLPVTAQDIVSGSDFRAWWMCGKGHEWDSIVYNRTRKGQGCSVCLSKRLSVGHNDLESQFPEIAKEWHPHKNGDLVPVGVVKGSGLTVWWKCEKEHEWRASIHGRTVRGDGCRKCSASIYTSKAEGEVKEFLESLGMNAIQSERTVIKPQEIDIYLPDVQVAIEYNGLRWHSEKYRDKEYHLNKFMALKALGIRLIYVWEDEWLNRTDVVKRMLAAKLGLAETLGIKYPELEESVQKIPGRSTVATEETVESARAFLEANHIQGFVASSHYLGLRDQNGILRAVLTMRKEKGGILNIVRYATNGIVQGGFSKLLSYAERSLKPTAFTTFADRSVSDGSLYENNGFVVDKILDPDYMYVFRGQRRHKFGYRLKRFKNDPDLLWEEGMTEKQLADLNGLPRIWDAGKVRYRKNVS